MTNFIKLFITIMILSCYQCLSFNLAQRCACSEYDKTVCESIGYCSYVNNSCQTLQCSTLTKEKCDASFSEQQCLWNSTSSLCESHFYQCSEFQDLDCYQNLYSKGCFMNNDKCQAYGSCSTSTESTCNFLNCSYSKTQGCQDSYSGITCSGTDEATCAKSNGQGELCAIDDNKQCSQIKLFPTSCGDYSNFKDQCTGGCSYNSTAKQCVQTTCADITEQSKCGKVTNLIDFTITPCIWKSSKCQEASDSDIQDMGLLCMAYTVMNYKWDSTSQKCSECTTFVDNHLYSFMKEYADGFNNQILLTYSFVLVMNLYF